MKLCKELLAGISIIISAGIGCDQDILVPVFTAAFLHEDPAIDLDYLSRNAPLADGAETRCLTQLELLNRRRFHDFSFR